MLKFAVIGCGGIAQKATIPALINSGLSQITVCMDPDALKEKDISEKFNLPFETDLQKVFNDYNFDAVYIASPIATHKDIILTAAKHRKHILCEKSIVTNLQEAKEVTDICAEKELALFEGFMYQFHSQHQVVRDFIENDEIGKPVHFQAWFGFPPLPSDNFRYNKNMGGGALLDAGAYTVHAARRFFEKEPTGVSSVLETEGKDVDIRGTVMLDFGNSQTAHLTFGFNNLYQSKYTVWGTKGLLTLERAFALPADLKPPLVHKKQDQEHIYALRPSDHFIEEIKYFVENYTNKEIRSKWREEIINQASLLQKIRKNNMSGKS